MAQSEIGIVLNEYSASNVGTPTDNYGEQSDWVELYNNFSTQVNFNGYYLSNDRSNLLKWRFPSNYVLPVNGYGVVWLSGRGVSSGFNLHANFTLEQCKDQWLILTYSSGGVQTVRDSVFVQKTKAGHSRGRVDYLEKGISHWNLFEAHSFLQPNPVVGRFIDYAPTPEMITFPAASPTVPSNSGGFMADGASVAYFRLKGDWVAYSYSAACFDIYYTTDGSRPIPIEPLQGTTQLYNVDDSILSPLLIDETKVIRAISVKRDTCNIGDYLPSFIETNSYFVLVGTEEVDDNFGVLSLAIDPADTAWFTSGGHPHNLLVHSEYYDKKKQLSEGYTFLNRPPQESWRTAQRGFYVNIDDKQGFGCNYEGPIFNVSGLGVSSRTVFPTLHVYAGDFESESNLNGANHATRPVQGTGLRDVFVQSLATKYNIDVNPLHVKPIRLYQNGKYMGVYTFKEVYDKYYENYYHNQPLDQQDLRFYYGQDAHVAYPDGASSQHAPLSNFRTSVYDIVATRPLTQSTPNSFYASIMRNLDKNNFIDYMAVNSYMMNGDLWNYNIALAKGANQSAPGSKWHHYLWNMPAILNFTAVATSTVVYPVPFYSPCLLYKGSQALAQPSVYDVSPLAINAAGKIMSYLMDDVKGNKNFQEEYQSRFQDLLNTALKCDNMLNHFDTIYNIYKTEMKYHDETSPFMVQPDLWDTNMFYLRQAIEKRCYFVANNLNAIGCFGKAGPYNITVNVEPAGAGKVTLNSLVLDNYPWTGDYYRTNLSLKATPNSDTYIFDHWEIEKNSTNYPLTHDSISIDFAFPDNIVAVFTDKTRDITADGENSNVPTGFTPNGDGINDVFKPLGSALYTTEYEMTIWNRWGQEVFRSLDPTVGWDGNFKGQQAITGVYAYIIRYKNSQGESKLAKGNVTLTR
ncbi:MAG: CotH kinase family protein [Bacteroidetes bacterium]|nr:CotH kinase family protein [Bacteroidota bacterium]